MNIEKLARLDRGELINKLKTAKDPQERDLILRLLSNRDVAGRDGRGPGGKSLSADFKLERLPDQPGEAERPAPPPETEATPGQLRVGRLIGYIFPVFFLIAGAVFTLESLAEVANGKPIQEAFAENPTGIFLIIFGLLGFLKNRKAQKPSAKI